MIKKKQKYKRNPKYVDDRYIKLLSNGLHTGWPDFLSRALTYYNIGDFCNDCQKDYDLCQCEGARDISGPCEECGQNRCICDYDIRFNEEYLDISYEKVRKEVWNLARRTLDEQKLLYL